MKTAKELVLTALFTAILIGGQFALSGVYGVEIVTVIFASYCFFFGVKNGLILANVYSLVRCCVFGLYPTVIILYFVYYNLFAVVVGFIGYKAKREYSIKFHAITVATVIVLTCIFTLLDDVITPLFYGIVGNAWYGYFYSSLVPMGIQVGCAAATMIIVFPLLIKLYGKIYKAKS